MSGTLGFGYEHPNSLGFRLIAPNHPGSANSNIHIEESLKNWTKDLAELLGREKLDEFIHVGFHRYHINALLQAVATRIEGDLLPF